MEEIINDCITRINVGLKSARMRSIEDMRRSFEQFNEAPQAVHPEHNRKIGRNEPCPCKSEKKYKKCCGLLH